MAELEVVVKLKKGKSLQDKLRAGWQGKDKLCYCGWIIDWAEQRGIEKEEISYEDVNGIRHILCRTVKLMSKEKRGCWDKYGWTTRARGWPTRREVREQSEEEARRFAKKLGSRDKRAEEIMCEEIVKSAEDDIKERLEGLLGDKVYDRDDPLGVEMNEEVPILKCLRHGEIDKETFQTWSACGKALDRRERQLVKEMKWKRVDSYRLRDMRRIAVGKPSFFEPDFRLPQCRRRRKHKHPAFRIILKKKTFNDQIPEMLEDEGYIRWEKLKVRPISGYGKHRFRMEHRATARTLDTIAEEMYGEKVVGKTTTGTVQDVVKEFGKFNEAVEVQNETLRRAGLPTRPTELISGDIEEFFTKADVNLAVTEGVDEARNAGFQWAEIQAPGALAVKYGERSVLEFEKTKERRWGRARLPAKRRGQRLATVVKRWPGRVFIRLSEVHKVWKHARDWNCPKFRKKQFHAGETPIGMAISPSACNLFAGKREKEYAEQELGPIARALWGKGLNRPRLVDDVTLLIGGYAQWLPTDERTRVMRTMNVGFYAPCKLKSVPAESDGSFTYAGMQAKVMTHPHGIPRCGWGIGEGTISLRCITPESGKITSGHSFISSKIKKSVISGVFTRAVDFANVGGRMTILEDTEVIAQLLRKKGYGMGTIRRCQLRALLKIGSDERLVIGLTRQRLERCGLIKTQVQRR